MTTQARLTSALAAQYEVKREIGAGGMATVFLARDIKHDRDVAIKVLHPDLGAALGAERFLSEIKTTAKLQHPHILPLIDSGEADSLLYYVMPFVVGESLRDRMEREGQLPIAEVIRIAREVAGALDYAHRQGVVHRDIKPENILLQDGQALVADFGIALAVSAAGGARMTQTGLSLGTPQYMSPEQAMGERTIDARSDIYALGAVTYEMLTGEPPFTGANVQAIVSKIMSQRPTPVSAVRDTVPPATEEAVMTALSKLPADRFATVSQFATALTTSSGVLTSQTSVPRAGAGRRRWDLLAQRVGLPAIPVALAAIALAVWALTRPEAALPVLRYSISLDSGQQMTNVGVGNGRLAISPDGSMIAFTGGPRGQLFIRDRNEFTARALPGTEGALEPTFSPDGRQIAFATFTYELKVVSVAGGAITTLSDSVVGRSIASWGSDNYIYAGGRLGGPLIRLRPVSGGTLELVTVLDSATQEVAHATPFALPDGQGVLFTAFPGGGRARAQPVIAFTQPGSKKHEILFEGFGPLYVPSGHLLYRASNAAVMAIRFDPKTRKTSGEPVAVSESSDASPFIPTDLDFSSTGTLMFTQGSRGTRELAWVSRNGSRQQVDSSWRGSFGFPSLSPDGRRVAVGLNDASGTNIWIKQLDRGPATKLTLEGTISNYPSWTPDGKSVSYYSNAKNRDLTLMKKRADASDLPIEISRFENPVESAWSPDGNWLITRTSVNSKGKGDIFAFRAGSDSAPIRIAATAASEQHPAVSPNGRWLAYSSGESGRMEVYAVPFPHTASTKWAVSANGGSEPAWSRDGRELYYRDSKGTMVAVAILPGETFATGATQELFKAFEYLSGPGHRMYDVAPDGRFLMIWTRGSATDSKIFVVENWFQELAKKFK